MNSPVILVVLPSRQSDGSKACSTRGQLFDGAVDGRAIVIRSTQPFLDGARALWPRARNPACAS